MCHCLDATVLHSPPWVELLGQSWWVKKWDFELELGLAHVSCSGIVEIGCIEGSYNLVAWRGQTKNVITLKQKNYNKYY